uniref:Uncharacterized protein n=1 Tax=uncultured marine virus TaxID=186617 RepID=S4TDM9_9VIRU|nr:hypothetical protein [uncultured marine virus]
MQLFFVRVLALCRVVLGPGLRVSLGPRAPVIPAEPVGFSAAFASSGLGDVTKLQSIVSMGCTTTPSPPCTRLSLGTTLFPRLQPNQQELPDFTSFEQIVSSILTRPGVGHQPYGRDTLASLYNHYVVDSAVITVSPIGSCTGKVYGITVADDSASSLDYSVLLEQKGNTSAIGTAGGTGNQAQIMARYNRFTQWPVFVDTSAPVGSNPDEEIYFTIWMADITDQVNDQVKFQVQIEYNVTFYEPKELAIS